MTTLPGWNTAKLSEERDLSLGDFRRVEIRDGGSDQILTDGLCYDCLDTSPLSDGEVP
jgi:hypothetical protein